MLRLIPLWVKLPNLPFNCWGKDTLRRIRSGLGRPLYADECISLIDRISYARIPVEINVTYELPSKVKVQDLSGRVFEQPIYYKWKPTYCTKCLILGHSCPASEAKKPTEQAIIKKTTKMLREYWIKHESKSSISSIGSVQQDKTNESQVQGTTTVPIQQSEVGNKEEKKATVMTTVQQMKMAKITNTGQQLLEQQSKYNQRWTEAKNTPAGKSKVEIE